MVNRNHVAAKAGVSVATVSRVFNDSGYVSEEKKRLVLDAAQTLGYRPNPVAISLKKEKTHQLLYFIKDLHNDYYLELYEGMVAYARPYGYRVIVSSDLDYDQIDTLMVDGVILPSEFFSSEDYSKTMRVPVVTASHGRIETYAQRYVMVSTGDALRMGLEHLVRMGHERIAYISPERCAHAEPRQKVFEDFMAERFGLTPGEMIYGPEHELKENGESLYHQIGFEAAAEFISRKSDATAAICFNDTIAIGFMSGLFLAGVHVPEDVSVMGIDGHKGSAYTCPPLTTVSTSPFLHGQECVRILLGEIEGLELAPVTMGVYLIERDSVKRREG
jgi:LacI family transcriptional regulator